MGQLQRLYQSILTIIAYLLFAIERFNEYITPKTVLLLEFDHLKHLSYYYDTRHMGISKKEVFSKSQNRLADVAKALGHPARIAILQFLAKQNACICGDIVDKIPLSQATVSQHLAELKRLGLIKGEIEGPRICYCIDQKAWNEAEQVLSQFFNDINN